MSNRRCTCQSPVSSADAFTRGDRCCQACGGTYGTPSVLSDVMAGFRALDDLDIAKRELREAREYGEKLHLLAQGKCEHCRGNPCVKRCMCPEPPPWVSK